MGVEGAGAAGMGGADGEPDQGGAERAHAPVVGGDGEARAPPDAGFRLMDAHGADDGIGDDAERGNGHEGDRHVIDGIAIVMVENTLFGAEDRAAEGGGAAPFPGLGRKFHPVFGRDEGGEGIADHATSLRS